MHRRHSGDRRHRPDHHPAQLPICLKCDGDHRRLAPATAPTKRVTEREAVATEPPHEHDRRRPLSELHKVHYVQLERGGQFLRPAAADGLDEVDDGRDVALAVDAGEDAELLGVDGGGRGGGGGGALELAVVERVVAAAGRLVDGHDCWRGDEGGEESH